MAKRVRRSNVKDGVLLPLGNGFSLVKGDNPNKTDDVDIGPNNKNGLSVNHGEILQQQGNTLRVFSAEPMFGGVSPVQLLYGSMAPDKVFAIQEQYKRANRIADDGTKYKDGGKINRNRQTWDTILNDEQEVTFNDWYKNISSKLKLNSNPNDYNHHYDYRGYWLENKDNNIDYLAKDFHFPDKYKKPTHETFSNESIYATKEYGINPKTVGHWKDNVFIPGSFNILMNHNYKNSLEKEGFYYSDDKQLSLRQRYAESSFNDKALNRWSKAAGAYQIMPHIHKAYVKATGDEGDLYDLEYNTAIRNWLMRDINKNAYIKDSRNNNRNKIIKTYAAYNWGSGNLGKLLKRLEKEGIDTFNSYDWIDKLPKETKDYVNFIVHGDDVNKVKNDIKFRESLDSLRNKKQFGGQTNINSLGERPNAKYRKQMKNKRNEAERGTIQPIGGYTFSKPFMDKYGNTIGIDGTISKLAVPSVNTGLVNPPKISSNIGSGLSTTAMGAIGAGINTLGALIGAGIQQSAINKLEAPKRQYTLLNPVKLKTKININPQIAKMREMQAQIADAARRTSGSSRTAYQKMLASHNRLLDSAMDLYGRRENIETELINRDRLNQQQVAHANATNVMNTVNYNNEAATEMRNRKRVATSNNWTTALNTTAGAWAGPNGFIDRANALRVKAGELYTQAIANPTAARLLYGDIDFTTGANKRRAFNTIYDFLNNNRFA